MFKFTKWFYGNEISEEGKRRGYVDYRTFAAAFNHVLANSLMSETDGVCGFWDQESGQVDNTEEIEEINEKIFGIEDLLYEMDESQEESEEYKKLMKEKEDLEDRRNDLLYEMDESQEVFQWYIIDDNGAEICKEFDEIVYYNETLDIYLWGVTHWGTSWDYVMTSIPCYPDEV